jgi:DHA2 family multidrug resistance protein
MLGIGLVFAPISVAAYKYIPVHLRGAAVGLLSLLRTEGGSVGTSAAKIIEDRRVQLHMSRIGEGLNTLNHDVQSYLEQAKAYLLQYSGDPSWARQASLQSLDDMRQQQAWSLSYFDVFFLCAVVSLALVVLVFFMKRSVAEPGERISAE